MSSPSISLTKGQRLSLTKADGSALSKIFCGLGWDAAKAGSNVDLDASAVLLDAGKNVIDTVWFRDKKSSRDPIFSNGDNLTGAGDGDDEVISVDLPRVPANVASIVFAVTSFSGHKFDKIENASIRVVDDSSAGKPELCKYVLGEKNASTALILARVYRHNDGWKIAALGEFCEGHTVQDLTARIKAVG